VNNIVRKSSRLWRLDNKNLQGSVYARAYTKGNCSVWKKKGEM
jgi:hypothetical protein